jgi:hypothetical protein
VATLALSIMTMLIVCGVLGGWAIREDRRRRAETGKD